MAWPTTKAGTTHLDAGSDNPGSARSDIKQNVDNVNDMIDTIVVTGPSATQVLAYDNSDSRFENVDIDTIAVTTSATQTLTNKTLTTPIISSISNTGTVTLPTSTDTLVGKATTDTFTNKSGNISQWTNDAGYSTSGGAISAVATCSSTGNHSYGPGFTKIATVTEDTDPQSILSITTGVITIGAGTYLIFCDSPETQPATSGTYTFSWRLQDTTNTETLKSLYAYSGPDAEPWTDGFTTRTFSGSTDLQMEINRSTSSGTEPADFRLAFMKV